MELFSSCWSAKEFVQNKCCSLKNAIMEPNNERRLRDTLRQKWTHVSTHIGDMYERAVDFSRNNLGRRFQDKNEPTAAAAAAAADTTTTTLPLSARHTHLVMEETKRPVIYLSMLLPCSPLLPIWSKEEQERLAAAGGGSQEKGRGETVVEGRFMFHLQRPFTSEDLEACLVQAVHSPALETQLMSIPRQDEGRSQYIGNLPANVKKNRYKNNVPYDDTRVVLHGEGQNTYINASYIDGNRGPRSFIATQGPRETQDRTIDDFWRMVWENNTNIIVMLGNLIEGGRGKVSQYWPSSGEETYCQLTVEMKCVRYNLDLVRRQFIVSKRGESRELLHYQYTGWPDHDVPACPVAAADMIRDIHRWHWRGPPVVHCSAGLGRTGCFLLVLRALDELRLQGVFHPLNTLRAIRRCRANVLDNVNQYRYAHQVMLEVLFSERTRTSLQKFPAYVTYIRKHLYNQFNELKSYPKNLTYEWATLHNPAMNRDSSVLPPDGRQVLLASREHHNINNSYKNVVRVRGSNLLDAFLVAEHPMAHTLGRIWKMAYVFKVSLWVFLHEYDHNDDFPEVFPANGHAQLEGVTIHVTGKLEKSFFTERTVTLTHNQSHQIRLIQLMKWRPGEDLPTPPQSLLYLAEYVEGLRQAAQSDIALITCCDGYSGSGLFVATARIVAELQECGQVDVYRIVQSILFDRPQFIINERQYAYLHDAILVYAKVQKMRQLIEMKEVRKTQNTVMEGRAPGRMEDTLGRGLTLVSANTLTPTDRQTDRRMEAKSDGNLPDIAKTKTKAQTLSHDGRLQYEVTRDNTAHFYADKQNKSKFKSRNSTYENIWPIN